MVRQRCINFNGRALLPGAARPHGDDRRHLLTAAGLVSHGRAGIEA